jgi:hypothetical protein
MTTPNRHAPAKTPRGLGNAGSRLWRALASEFVLEVHEELLLIQACRTVDRLDSMAAELSTAPLTVTNHRGDQVPHPLLTESRQQSIVLTRLLASLRVPDAVDERPQRRGAARGSYGLRAVK